MAFAMQGISSLIYVFFQPFLIRPIWKDSLFKEPIFDLRSLRWVIAAGGGDLFTSFAGIFSTVAISIGDWLWLFGGGLLLIIVVETIKAAYFRNGD